MSSDLNFNEAIERFESALTWLVQTPNLWLLLMVVPLVLSAWIRRVYPSGFLLTVLALPALLSLLMLLNRNILWVILVLDALIFVTALVDWCLLPRQKKFKGERKVMKIASIAQKQEVQVTVSNLGNLSCRADIKDDQPDEFERKLEFFPTRLKSKSRSSFSYTFTPMKRGKFYLRKIFLRLRSNLRLWNTLYELECESQVNVFPDLKQISEFEILARTNRLSLFGVRKTRKIGQDHEFERLRDYNQDDNYKNIDWRTTARRQKLTVKDFQSSQSQRLIFLVDCGRMMTNRAGDISLLDHSLNAMLMLSYVALKRGDSVGLICFSDRIHNFIPAKNSMAQMNHLLHASFDQHPKMVESRYDEAFLYLRTHCLKRSLVITITNLIDEINANQIQLYLRSLVGRHLPLGVLMRDHQIFNALDRADRGDKGLYEASAAADILTWRQQVINDLQHQGVLSLDVFPEDLTAGLINQYLKIKARHLL